jgi:hypothetical protein
MEKLNVYLVRELIAGLPQAFDHQYWDMGDTTYKEEVALAAVEALGLKGPYARRFLTNVGITKRDYPVLHYFFDGHLDNANGAYYGITKIGKKFIDKFTHERYS